MASERPIADVKELVAHFESGCKPASQERVGLEHEKIAVLDDGRAPGYDLIARLLEEEAKRRGWERIEEHGQIIALEGGRRGTVTLEPGGQVEHSGAPWPSAVDAALDLQIIFTAEPAFDVGPRTYHGIRHDFSGR